MFLVCSARALSNGWKSRVSPNSGNYIAKGKGVHREVKSERCWRQTSDLTPTGIALWVENLTDALRWFAPKAHTDSTDLTRN